MALSNFDTRIKKFVQLSHSPPKWYQIWNVKGYRVLIYVFYVSLLDII